MGGGGGEGEVRGIIGVGQDGRVLLKLDHLAEKLVQNM